MIFREKNRTFTIKYFLLLSTIQVLFWISPPLILPHGLHDENERQHKHQNNCNYNNPSLALLGTRVRRRQHHTRARKCPPQSQARPQVQSQRNLKLPGSEHVVCQAASRRWQFLRTSPSQVRLGMPNRGSSSLRQSIVSIRMAPRGIQEPTRLKFARGILSAESQGTNSNFPYLFTYFSISICWIA